jgi:CRP-like cAMP-binding protein
MFGKAHRTVSPARLAAFRGLPMFEHFSDSDLERIDSLGCQTTLPAGEVLTVQGRHGREAFIVLSGAAAVSVDGEVVAHVHAGDVVGEMAMFDNLPRSATVVATTDLEVFAVDPREFAALFSDPRTARWVATQLTKRLRDVEQNHDALAATAD